MHQGLKREKVVNLRSDDGNFELFWWGNFPDFLSWSFFSGTDCSIASKVSG